MSLLNLSSASSNLHISSKSSCIKQRIYAVLIVILRLMDKLGRPMSSQAAFKEMPITFLASYKAANVAQPRDTGMVSEKDGEVLQKIGTEETTSINTHPVVCDSAPINPKEENSSNINMSSVTTKEREETGFIKEKPITEEVDAEASSLNKVQIFRKSSSVESGLDSLDESNISEIQRESNDDRLRRRIEYYKKCNDSLQKEVEEERNASAVATNEAMSIITRLQEEKAALEMEALQYFRMMEKQAEYDNDELEKVNGLLTEKEKEIQDLEAELEFYRSNMTSSNGSLEDHLACKNNTPPLSWQARIRIAAETAAALAAASMIFKKVDPTYS
ncbi:hypothetical protein JHK85_037397 [Glycine max]|nr:hypothetical protein JHK85_037397 [Glycine max]